MVNQPGQAIAARWLAPLDEFQHDPKLTDASWYDYGDVFKGARDFVVSNGTQWIMPITAEAQILYTREDLVPTPPATMEEWLPAAKKATSRTTAGIGMRASSDPSETPWPYGGFVFTDGGYFIDPSGKPTLDSTAAVDALELYTELLRQAGPKGVTSWGWLQAEQAFEQGSIAMWTDSTAFASTLLNSSTSRYAHKTALNLLPTYHGTRKPNVWYWTIGINRRASKKEQEAAWLFVQWATSKPVYEATGPTTGTAIRSSAWATAKMSDIMGPAPVSVIRKALEGADSTPMALAWNNKSWAQIASYVAEGVSSAVAGSSSVKAAASTMQAKAFAAMK